MVNSAEVNTRERVSFRIVAVSGYIPSSGIAGLCGRLLPSF